MKSKKQLFIALDKFFQTDKYTKEQLNAVSNETYGRKSCIYVDARSFTLRKLLEKFLTQEGFKVNTNYYTQGTSTEVQVSYFKGDGWYE